MKETIAPGYHLGVAEEKDTPILGRLYRMGIPEANISALGDRFAGEFVRLACRRRQSRVLVVRNDRGDVVAFLAATLHRHGYMGETLRKNWMRLALAANVRVFSPRVLAWCVRAAVGKLLAPLRRGDEEEGPVIDADAQVFAMAVTEEARGMGMAERMLARMEQQYRDWGYTGKYLIFTLANNEIANRLYRKIGMECVGQIQSQNGPTNVYVKSVVGGEAG